MLSKINTCNYSSSNGHLPVLVHLLLHPTSLDTERWISSLDVTARVDGRLVVENEIAVDDEGN